MVAFETKAQTTEKSKSRLELKISGIFPFKLQPNCSRPLIVPSVSNGNRTAPDRRPHDWEITLRTNAATTSSLLAKPTPCALPPLEEPTCFTCSTALLLLTTTMSPPRYMMCKESVRAAAEKAAAAAILIELSKTSSTASTPSGPGAVATAAAQAKTMPDITNKDASCVKMRALCAAANLVNSTLRLLSLRAFHSEAKVGRQEDDILVEERVVPQPESAGVVPQPDVAVAPSAVAVRDDNNVAAPVVAANVPEPAGGVAPACYAYRHSWRRRKVPVVVAGGDEAAPVVVANIPEPVGDVPACYAYRHSCWRRCKVPAVVVVAAGGEEAAPVTSEAPAGRSTERRDVRVRIVVAGAVVGIREAAPVAAENPLNDDCEDLSSLEEEVDFRFSSPAPNALGTSQRHVAVAVSPEAPEPVTAHEHLSQAEFRDVTQPRPVGAIREGFRGRLLRPNRGGRYAAALAALLPARRRPRT
jgi:hypothetical protein